MDAVQPTRPARDPGTLLVLLAGLALLGFALSVDFPRRAFGFQSDESTYYSLAWSLAEDGDFAFDRGDLARVWREFPSGPEGIFLKKGKSIRIAFASEAPFVRVLRGPDPIDDRLYYGKAYIYPLVAAPFVWLFGTNGFLVLHALLLTASLGAAYALFRTRTTPLTASALALAFVFASAVPVYFVWLTPEVLNLSLCTLGLFAWAFKETAPALVDGRAPGRWGKWLRSNASDVAAAVLLGMATFSKPLNIVAIGPVLLLLLWRRQWLRLLGIGAIFVAVVALLFALNAAITGEMNYQGGDRKTFYGGTGFPFQTEANVFETTGAPRTTNEVPVDVLTNRDALLRVFPANVVYFVFGRHTGLVPYFFPGVWLLVRFLAGGRDRRAFQWCALAGLVVAAAGLLLYMPYTYSGGGGPIGNRYFLGFYALFMLLIPAGLGWGSAIVMTAVGALFTAQLVANPFYVSFHPAEHAKRGPYRLLPIELSLTNDLPINVVPSRIKIPLGGDPPLLAYFLDDNAYALEGEWFWVRGASRADLIVRAPATTDAMGRQRPLVLTRVVVDVRNGDVANEVTASSSGQRSRLALEPGALGSIPLQMGRGVPYHPVPGLPTNYVYRLSLASAEGFVPLFTSGLPDNRYLGAMVRVRPVYE